MARVDTARKKTISRSTPLAWVYQQGFFAILHAFVKKKSCQIIGKFLEIRIS